MKLLFLTFCLIVSAQSFAKDKWWIVDGQTYSCILATGVDLIDPIKVMTKYPTCTKEVLSKGNNRMMIIDCLNTSLKTQFAYGNSLEFCKKLLNAGKDERNKDKHKV